MRNTFKFLDDELNQQLIILLRKAKISHAVGKNGVIYYFPDDEEVIEDDFICLIRDRAFPSWQVLTCPPEWSASYKKYTTCHAIPFQEELSNGELWFLLPRNYRPHRWKLDSPTIAERMVMR